MAMTPKIEDFPETLLPEPVRPESWECCGSECGDACIQNLYYAEKAKFDAQQIRLREFLLSGSLKPSQNKSTKS